jgi:hypothetical protein
VNASTSTDVVAVDAVVVHDAVGEGAGLGAAAERFARLSLRKSKQTKATYESSYRRFAAWLAEHHHGTEALARARAREEPMPQAPLSAFTVDALAAYLDELEATRAPATVKKERAALNRLAKYLHTLGVIDATEILLIEGSRGAGAERKRTRWIRPPGAGSRRSPARA